MSTAEADTTPQYIEVHGRKGYNNEMNGIYARCKEDWHNHPQWKQVSFAEIPPSDYYYIRYQHDKDIWIFDWVTVSYSKYCSYAQCEDLPKTSSPLQCANQWKVWNTDTRTYVMDPAVNIRPISKQQYEEQERLTNSIPEVIVVSGRVGYNKSMNGIYSRCYPDHQNRPQWKHKTTTFWIRWNAAQTKWIFDWEKENNWYVEAEQDVVLPTLVTKPWAIWNKTDKLYNDVDPKVKLVGFESEDRYMNSMKSTDADIPSYIDVKGRVGYNNEMNGTYIRVDKNWEGRPMYVQAGKNRDPFTIRWWPEKAKWVMDWRAVYKWYVEHEDGVGHPCLCAHQKWKVWNPNSKAFETDTQVELVPLTKEQYEQRQEALKVLVPGPSYILVSGREGYNHEMNGLYCRIQRDWEKRPQYVNPVTNFIIRWHAGQSIWIFDWKQVYSWYAECKQDVADPSLCEKGQWAVWNTKSKAYDDFDDKLIVKAVDPKDKEWFGHPIYIEVFGRRGFNAQNINGLYKLEKGREMDGKPCWKKQNQSATEYMVQYNPAISKWELVFDDNCWMRCKQKNKPLPIPTEGATDGLTVYKRPKDDSDDEGKSTDEHEWEVFVRFDEEKEGKWVLDGNVKVKQLTMIDIFGHGLLCPLGDGLRCYHAENEEIACNLCGTPLELTDIMYRCINCDYNYCHLCGENLDEIFAEIRSNDEHFSKVYSIAWSPNDSDDIFATCSHDGDIKIWNVLDRCSYLTARSVKGNCKYLTSTKFNENWGKPKCVQFSNTGKYIAVRSNAWIGVYELREVRDPNSGAMKTEFSKPKWIDIRSIGSDLSDKSMIWIDDAMALIASNDKGIYLVNMVGKQILRIMDDIDGAFQIVSAEITDRFALVAMLELPSKKKVDFIIVDRKKPTTTKYTLAGVIDIGGGSANTKDDQTTAQPLSGEGANNVQLESIGFGGRSNFWFVSGDNMGHMHFWRINILNEDDIDITDPSHLRPEISFTNYPIKHKDQRHFLPVLSCAGSTGSNTIVSGSKDGNLVLWSLHDGKPAVSLFVEQAGGIQGRCNEIWTVDIRPGQAIFGTWNRTVGLFSVVDRALVLLREEDKHQKHGEKHHANITAVEEDAEEEKLNEMEAKLRAMGVNNENIKFEYDKQWSVLNAWYSIWINGDALLYGIQSMVKGVIDNLKSDKIDYIKLHQQVQVQDAIDFGKVCELVEDMNRNSIEDQYKGVIVKQDTNDLIEIMQRGYHIQKALIALARTLATQERVWGIFEGDPGIKKLQRSVEKCVLKKFESLIKEQQSEESTKGKSKEDDGLWSDQTVTYNDLKDLSRGGILCRNMNAIYHALYKLRESEFFLGTKVKIVRIKNRFGWKHSSLGYRDILINLVFPDIDPTFIAELQLHHRSFHEIRSRGSGHANYKAARFLLDFVVVMAESNITFKKASPARDEIQALIHELLHMN